MKNYRCPFLADDESFHELIQDYISANAHRIRAKRTRKECGQPISAFRRWFQACGATHINEQVVKDWMLERCRNVSHLTVSLQAIKLSGFCKYLVERGMLTDNPFQTLRDKHRRRGFRGIAQLLKSTGSSVELDAEADIPFSGPLGKYFHGYLDYISSLGRSRQTPNYHLASFERFLRNNGISDFNLITATFIQDWQEWMGVTSEHQTRYRLVVLEGFYNYLVGQLVVEKSPMPPIPPHRRKSKTPYVFTREEVEQILCKAALAPDHRLMPYRGPTYHIVFLLMYALGLRSCEVLSLRLNDLDFIENSIVIHETKFNKSRALPFGPRLGAALKKYIDGSPLLKGVAPSSFLFATESHRTPHLAKNSAYRFLKSILRTIPIRLSPDVRSPNLHSFRHSFAVHRIERWHREGANVGQKLPLLSVFMGHCDVAATQVYLTMTPERLRLVGESFESAYGKMEV